MGNLEMVIETSPRLPPVIRSACGQKHLLPHTERGRVGAWHHHRRRLGENHFLRRGQQREFLSSPCRSVIAGERDLEGTLLCPQSENFGESVVSCAPMVLPGDFEDLIRQNLHEACSFIHAAVRFKSSVKARWTMVECSERAALGEVTFITTHYTL